MINSIEFTPQKKNDRKTFFGQGKQVCRLTPKTVILKYAQSMKNTTSKYFHLAECHSSKFGETTIKQNYNMSSYDNRVHMYIYIYIRLRKIW